MVGLTAFTNEIKPCAYVAARIKERLRDVVTVIGGVHVTAIPEQTMTEFPMFDIGVVGEGEETLLQIVTALHEGRDVSGVNGTLIRLATGLLKAPARQRPVQLDLLDAAWDVFAPARAYHIQTIRGCPFNCVFCMNPNGRVARARSVQSVMDELEHLITTYLPERISFGDELFSVYRERTLELLRAMADAEIGSRVKWDVQTHVRYVDDEIFELFKKARVDRVEMGIESGDEEALRRMGKGTDLAMIQRAYMGARKHGVPFGTFFLLGQPNETLESVKKTIRLAGEVNPMLPMFGLMVPYPGTAVAKMAAKGENGYRLVSTDWDDYNKQIGGALEFSNISRRELEILQFRAYVTVFIRNLRIRDFIKFLWEYRAGVYHAAKNMVTGGKIRHGRALPDRYVELVDTGQGLSSREIVRSHADWSAYQNRSMAVMKRTMLSKL